MKPFSQLNLAKAQSKEAISQAKAVKRLMLATAALLGSVVYVHADDTELVIHASHDTEQTKETVIIPIIGAMESTGLLAGSVVAVTGLGQPQAQAVGFGAYSVNNSYISYLGYFNYALSARWTFDISALQADFTDTEMYLGEQPDDPIDVPGDASYLQRDWQMTFRYLINQTPAKPVNTITGVQAQPVTRVLEVEPFYKSREFRSDNVANVAGETYGISVTLDQDARDYTPSPSRGYHSYAKVLRDWGGSERASYTRWEVQHSQYFDLGSNRINQQQTLSLTGYLSDIPTWQNDKAHRQPDWFAQSVLGGPDRMRGYGDNYMHDRSALFYGAELRMIPKWQPQSRVPVLSRYDFPWWQTAVFAELGNVSDKLDFSALHNNMKWSAGVGIRVFIENIIARADFGFSKDDSIFRFTVNQPF
ncbi:BamA/TamA family outer membrane protein [Shewanella sp. Scap07]|uniref:BamA/TamA family outer membrane protein n=1 Tax=Shewanella sp. Scap07 TaxID=2589987 RepID=UPI0015BE4205|nr:BamA/TamA family outer membrane protein [Shewanella sp. Scap07]QLE84145.1 BamA/TamA family outer membrane protein [Shewanella sp. Scap07]